MPLDLIEILSRTSNNDIEAYENDEAEIRQQIPIGSIPDLNIARVMLLLHICLRVIYGLFKCWH